MSTITLTIPIDRARTILKILRIVKKLYGTPVTRVHIADELAEIGRVPVDELVEAFADQVE